jgi:hypothetical protein
VGEISEGVERDRGWEKGGVGFDESAAVKEGLGGKQTCLNVDLCKCLREELSGESESESEWNLHEIERDGNDE